MQKYAFNMKKYAANMHKICRKYAKNMPLHRLQHSKYAQNMHKICSICNKICKKYAKNMQNMHKSMYLHILHIYALPTLLMYAVIICKNMNCICKICLSLYIACFAFLCAWPWFSQFWPIPMSKTTRPERLGDCDPPILNCQ